MASGRALPTRDDAAWQSRPLAAGFVNGVVLIAPFAASIVAGLLGARLLAAPSGWAVVPWAGVIVTTSILASVVADRASRRLLPLAPTFQ